MIVEKNTELLRRKQLLLSAIANGNKDAEECAPELESLNKQININMQEALKQCDVEMRENIKAVKQKNFSDGDIKRNAARVMIRFFQEFFTDDEIKGICRQGYKIMRGKA